MHLVTYKHTDNSSSEIEINIIIAKCFLQSSRRQLKLLVTPCMECCGYASYLPIPIYKKSSKEG